jgi:hypothetical protein
MAKASIPSLALASGLCIAALASCTVNMQQSNATGAGGKLGKGGQTSAGGLSNEAGGTGGSVATNAAGAAGSGPQACGTVTDVGQCTKDVLSYCNAGVLNTIDCSTVGATCQLVGGSATCQQLTRSLGCESLTSLGMCDGAKMRYCDNTALVGVPREVDCAAYGQLCSPTGAPNDNGAHCVPQGTCPADVTENGVCSAANHLRFCEAGNLYDFDCGLDECKAVSGFSDCFMTTVATGCGAETAVGRCDGQTRISCPGNTVIKEDCSAIGLVCLASATGASCQRGTTCVAPCPTGYSCKSGLCSPTTTPTREWTIAVYVAGNNNLSDAAWADLNEMEVVGSSNSFAVVAEAKFSPKYSNAVPEQYQGPTYRMLVKADTDPETVTSLSSAQTLSSTNMSDPAALSAFVKWAAESYPAKRFALVLWDHGMGYDGGLVDESSGSTDYLTLQQIVTGVRDSGVHPDLVAFDACLMGMHEIALAMRGVTDWMAASEEIEPGSGYPYDKILAVLQQTPTSTPKQLGAAIVDSYGYASAQSPRSSSATQSLVDLSKSLAFNDELSRFAEVLSSNLSENRLDIRNAFDSSDVLRFHTQDHADVGTALAALGNVSGSVGTSAATTGSAYGSSGLIADNAAQTNVKSATGLAFFFPQVGFTATSLFEYRQETGFLPLQSWYTALANLQNNKSTTTTPGTGAIDAFSIILSWANTPDGKQSAADLDLYVYEPSGDFAVAVNGAVSENGLLSGDSYDTGVARESYELKSEHLAGTYIVLVHFYDGPKGESAYPRLQLFRSDLPGGSRTYVRGKIVDRALTEFPMNNDKPLTTMIDQSNFAGVQNLDYSNIWYAFTVEVN